MPLDIDYSQLPEHLRPGVKLYIEEGILPGDFLRLVISNKLKEAFMYADDINQHRMFDIVSFFYNQAPIGCWGSETKMFKWSKKGGRNARALSPAV